MTKPYIIYIPVEPLTERYTEQWHRCFPQAFDAAGFNVQVIDGEPLLENEIRVGAFLDINSTVHYKMTQLQAVAKLFHLQQVPQGTIFFVGDIELWGLESIRLMAQMNKIDVKIVGFLHAASYTKEDAFAIADKYQRYTEIGWLAALDRVFVGSAYHKQTFMDHRLGEAERQLYADRIKVTKNPLFVDEYDKILGVTKQKKVLLTNRFDPEKRPGATLELFRRLKARYPDWEFVVTTSRPAFRGSNVDNAKLNQLVGDGIVEAKAGLTKAQYHRELASAYMVVSHSIEENYGYCVAEAIHYGCVPILRAGLSHSEFVSPAYLFCENDGGTMYMSRALPKSAYAFSNSFDAACHWIDRFKEGSPHISLDTSGMQNIINELKLLENDERVW